MVLTLTWIRIFQQIIVAWIRWHVGKHMIASSLKLKCFRWLSIIQMITKFSKLKKVSSKKVRKKDYIDCLPLRRIILDGSTKICHMVKWFRLMYHKTIQVMSEEFTSTDNSTVLSQTILWLQGSDLTSN